MDNNTRNAHHDHHHGMEMESKPTKREQSAPQEGMEHHTEKDFSPTHAAHAEQRAPIDHASHIGHEAHIAHTGHEGKDKQLDRVGHGAHADHTDHERMFRTI